jgi:hypothetical protein
MRNFPSRPLPIYFLFLLIIFTSIIKSHEPAKAETKKTIWSYSQIENPDSLNEPIKLSIMNAITKLPIITAKCFAGENAAKIPLRLWHSITDLSSQTKVTFSKEEYKATFKTIKGKTNKLNITPLQMKMSLRDDFWNALLATKSMNYQVHQSHTTNLNLMYGSEKRISEFLSSCRARSLGINPQKKQDNVITRLFTCNAKETITVKINMSGTKPTVYLSYKDDKDVKLNSSLETQGIIYKNSTYKLYLQQNKATLESKAETLTCRSK